MSNNVEDFEKKLDFSSDTFQGVLRDASFVLQRLLGNMVEKGATEGSMNIKLEVDLKEQYILDYTPEHEKEERLVRKPVFAHKVTSTVQIKDEKKGNLDTEMELVLDEDTGEYIMAPIVDTEQKTIFDSDYKNMFGGDDETCVNDEDYVDGNAIQGEEHPALPGPTDEEEQNTSDEDDGKRGNNKCITGWSRYGNCVCCGKEGVQCCNQCQESCNSRCGWVDNPYVPNEDDEIEDISDEIIGKGNDGDDESQPPDDDYGYEKPKE